VGKDKLARETGLSVSDAKKLIEAYWKRNWAVKQLSEDTITKKVNGELWLFNPVSRFWYSLRNEKDIFSTLNQGTGVYCFDTWIRVVRKKRSQLTAQFHDEIVSAIKKGKETLYEKILKDSIKEVNELLKLNVNLDVDVQFGQTYAEIH
jgi:DNA polymerase I-like protein with 3'-5' exonuclease and polymerase domains